MAAATIGELDVDCDARSLDDMDADLEACDVFDALRVFDSVRDLVGVRDTL